MSMITRILRWICGWVRVEAEGGYPERLLNMLSVITLRNMEEL